MEFKGTKGKWELHKNKKDIYVNNKLIITAWSENTDDLNERINGESWMSLRDRTKEERHERTVIKPSYNALLCSKAPEMLEMLIKVYKNVQLDSISRGKLEKLIKEATEL
jgi:hypothetical protein